MCGPGFEPDATLALPQASIAVMGPEAAVNAVYYNKIQEKPEAERAAYVEELREQYRAGRRPLQAGGRPPRRRHHRRRQSARRARAPLRGRPPQAHASSGRASGRFCRSSRSPRAISSQVARAAADETGWRQDTCVKPACPSTFLSLLRRLRRRRAGLPGGDGAELALRLPRAPSRS